MVELTFYCDSYAIGGLSGGEDKDSFWRVVAQCTAALPEDKPRYVMGVGYPLDIVVCSALGADMYDCVYPTRTARFGTALIPELKNRAMANDERPIDPTCLCMVCRNYTRAYLHCVVTKDPMGSQLVSYHNLSYMMRVKSLACLEADICLCNYYLVINLSAAKQGPSHINSQGAISRVWFVQGFLRVQINLHSISYSSQRVISQSGFAMRWRLLVLTSRPAVLLNNRGIAERNLIDERLHKTK
ncbi:hypothetical protein GW17_00016440 [Ensete ventricosum]|nr:hypothetical protein GW17_00016440 [Ensete ventricosum]